MVHVVEGRQYNTYTVQATSMPAPQLQRWSLRLTLIMTSFDAHNHRRQTQQRSIASERQVDRGMVRSMHSTILYSALLIHRITSAKRTSEVRPVVLVRESSTQCIHLIHVPDI